jgi:hypothetical protein
MLAIVCLTNESRQYVRAGKEVATYPVILVPSKNLEYPNSLWLRNSWGMMSPSVGGGSSKSRVLRLPEHATKELSELIVYR